MTSSIPITEIEVFKLLIEQDQKSIIKTDIAILAVLMSSKYNVELSVSEKELLRPCLKHYHAKKKRHFVDKHIKVDWDQLAGLAERDALFTLSSGADQVKSRKRKSLEELSSQKQLKNRTNEMWEQVQLLAEEENVTESRILGLLLTRCSEKESRDIGKDLWESKSIDDRKKLPIDTALAIYTDCRLGRETYTSLKRVLKEGGYNILPAWHHLREKQNEVTPAITNLPEPHVGVYFKLIPALTITATRILENLTEMDLRGVNSLSMKYKFGFDGSGGHAIFSQQKNEQTNNLILSMFCPLQLKKENGEIVWIQSMPNTPKTQRALMIQTGKESSETLQSLTLYNDDMSTAKDMGFTICLNSEKIAVKASCASYMMDRKASNIYLGLGGAYCDLCEYTKQDCLEPLLIENGIEITRTVENLHNIFNELQTDEGTIRKQRNDYRIRTGITNGPIATNEAHSTQVLHALLRCTDMYMQTVVHIHAGVLEWTEAKSNSNLFLKKSKRELQQLLLNQVEVIRWDFPDPTGQCGNTTTGNTARKLLHCSLTRETVVSTLPDRYKQRMRKFGMHLSTVIRIICSKKKVNVEAFKEFCINLNVFLLTEFPREINRHLPGPWISITPTLHKVLAHSWELILLNEGFGLGSLDESGLEGNNKILRAIRSKLSRKISQQSNLVDSLHRLWLESDPVVHSERAKGKPYCKDCDERGHSVRYCPQRHIKEGPLMLEEALVQSLFI